jgi:hypothetical protein
MAFWATARTPEKTTTPVMSPSAATGGSMPT